MKVEFDSAKSERNERERGLSFEHAAGFDFETAWIDQDLRRVYPEDRFVAIGYLGDRLHVLCFTPIDSGIRVISFRKANLREIKDYEYSRSLN